MFKQNTHIMLFAYLNFGLDTEPLMASRPGSPLRGALILIPMAMGSWISRTEVPSGSVVQTSGFGAVEKKPLIDHSQFLIIFIHFCYVPLKLVTFGFGNVFFQPFPDWKSIGNLTTSRSSVLVWPRWVTGATPQSSGESWAEMVWAWSLRRSTTSFEYISTTGQKTWRRLNRSCWLKHVKKHVFSQLVDWISEKLQQRNWLFFFSTDDLSGFGSRTRSLFGGDRLKINDFSFMKNPLLLSNPFEIYDVRTCKSTICFWWLYPPTALRSRDSDFGFQMCFELSTCNIKWCRK